ncbi:hypothetical protein N7U66_04255 [Lacinutrix neustonica]|uniref:Uncharacterized protein n=1 Tax=Lacinutrix neustonica TaxID=2980107 RepID=A0A9E8SDW1_9FLAO|nr:hypothetical protein [Lacinutrix neustonica]WAC02853.1 hypothetical protein N7U66_04255 [Lacinutrix neustonica]
MKNILFILPFLFCALHSQAQVKVADQFFKDYAYYQAAELYLETLKKGDTTAHVLSRLGDCYYNNSNVKLANFSV